MPEETVFIDVEVVPGMSGDNIPNTWDLSAYFIETPGYLKNGTDIVGNPLKDIVLPPNAVSGSQTWYIRHQSGGNASIAFGYIDERTYTILPVESSSNYLLSYFLDANSADTSDIPIVQSHSYSDETFSFSITYFTTDPICWTLTYRGPKGKMKVERGPGRPPSKFILPYGSDISTVKLVEDGVLIPPKRYKIIVKG